MGTAPGRATHRRLLGRGGATTWGCTPLPAARDGLSLFLPPRTSYDGRRRGGGVPGHRSSAHRRFTTLPTRSRRGAWIYFVAGGYHHGRYHDRSSGRICNRRGPTWRRPLQAAGRATGSPHGGPSVRRGGAGHAAGSPTGGRHVTTGTSGRESKPGAECCRSDWAAGAADRREEPAQIDGLGWQGP